MVVPLTVNEAPREARNARADTTPDMYLDIPVMPGCGDRVTGLWPSRNLM